MSDIFASFSLGFVFSLALIVAIGAQNAFIIRQGLRRRHLALIATTASVIDAALIWLGVAFLAQVLSGLEWIEPVFSAVAFVILLLYSAQSFWAAWRKHRIGQGDRQGHENGDLAKGIWPTFLAILAFTLLNPHVYLDTVILLGGRGALEDGALKWWFAAGGSAASGLWFFAITYGSAAAAPLLSSVRAQMMLDMAVGVLMLLFVLGFALHFLGQ